jgi:sigma-E factor negative regulatory protein RseC
VLFLSPLLAMQAGCIPAGRKGSGQSFRPESSPSVSGLLRNGVNGMRERGVVTRIIPPDVIEVSLQASEACGRCGACHPGAEGRVCIEAVGGSGVKTGDAVEIEISTGGVVATSFVVYLLPVVFLIAGYIFGSTMAGFFSIRISGETGGIAGALFLLTASFWVVRWYDRHVRRRGTLRARVIRILPEGENRVNINAASL